MSHVRFVALLLVNLLAVAPEALDAFGGRAHPRGRARAGRARQPVDARRCRRRRDRGRLARARARGTTERALAVARRHRLGWQVLPTHGYMSELATEWIGALPAGGRTALVARRRVCGDQRCFDVLHVFHLEARVAEAAGSVYGWRGETLAAVAVDATSSVAQTGHGQSRALGLAPNSGTLWLGPWTASPQDAVLTRPIAMATGGFLALTSD